MSTFNPKDSDYPTIDLHGKTLRLLSKDAFAQFDVPLLGLGRLDRQAKATDAIAAVFDLEGFTNFCKQIEPHLSVPLFLGEFLAWLMKQLKEEMVHKRYKTGVRLYSPLPFFVKFMGDGLLVLWNASSMSEVSRRNVIVSVSEICSHYSNSFFPIIKCKVVEPPPRLRCGLARGTVYSVGDDNDYVGSCINMAARLQRIPGVTFAFNRRGFNIDGTGSEFFEKDVVVRRVSIRGIGENELIAILSTEFEALAPEDKKRFRAL